MKIYIFKCLLLICAVPVLTMGKAQPTLLTPPKVGDISTGEYAYVTGIQTGSMGINQLWDYSLLIDSAAESITKFVSPGITPYYSTFPQADLAASLGDTLLSYYQINAGNFLILGGASTHETFNYAHPYLTYHYPLTYGDEYQDSASLYFSIPGQKDTTLMLDTVKVTGYGTLKLPGQIYTDVLQLRHINIVVARFYVPGYGEIKLPPKADTTYSYFKNGIASPLLFYSSSNAKIQLISYYKAAALPVDFISFTANATLGDIRINWETGNEVNTNSFIIQRSNNGQQFSNIGELKALGSATNRYQYKDTTAATSLNGFNQEQAQQNMTIYYRLKQLDNNGRFTYSSVISCQISTSKKPQIYPNPASNKITVYGAIGYSWYNIYSPSAQLISTGKIHSEKVNINISQLLPGIYLLEMGGITNNQPYHGKFIKR